MLDFLQMEMPSEDCFRRHFYRTFEFGLFPDLSRALYDVFVTRQLFQTHRTPGVEFLRGDAHFATQAEFAAVGKARGRVDIHGGRIDMGREIVRSVAVFGNDAV